MTHYCVALDTLTHGQRCAQLIHAAGDTGPAPEGCYAVALEASARELLKLESQLRSASIPYRAIREPDPPFNGELVAIGIFPCLRESVNKYTKRLRVIK